MKKILSTFFLSIVLISILVFLVIGDVSWGSSEKTNKLPDILNNLVENTTIEGGHCLEYSLYYQDYLNKTHSELDVRRIEKVGICKIGMEGCGEWEGIPHTYLIVNGYGGECILDQHNLVCIQVIKYND